MLHLSLTHYYCIKSIRSLPLAPVYAKCTAARTPSADTDTDTDTRPLTLTHTTKQTHRDND